MIMKNVGEELEAWGELTVKSGRKFIKGDFFSAKKIDHLSRLYWIVRLAKAKNML